jgi:hypothetical protein
MLSNFKKKFGGFFLYNRVVSCTKKHGINEKFPLPSLALALYHDSQYDFYPSFKQPSPGKEVENSV